MPPCEIHSPRDSQIANGGSNTSAESISYRDISYPTTYTATDKSSNSMSPVAVAGICIAVVFTFIIAGAAFVLHFRRERARDAWDRAHGYAASPGLQETFSHHETGSPMSAAVQRYARNAFGKRPRAASDLAGEVPPDKAEDHLRTPKHIHDRKGGRAMDCAQALRDPRLRRALNPCKLSLQMSSFSKIRPQRLQTETISLPISVSAAARQEHEMQISVPASNDDVRFNDGPIGESVIYATTKPRPVDPKDQVVNKHGCFEVPLRSGESTLFGY